MARTFYTQEEYDLLIEFIEWYRENYEEADARYIETADTVVQEFLSETEEPE